MGERTGERTPIFEAFVEAEANSQNQTPMHTERWVQIRPGSTLENVDKIRDTTTKWPSGF